MDRKALFHFLRDADERARHQRAPAGAEQRFRYLRLARSAPAARAAH